MFRHVVLFTWKDGVTAESGQALAAQLRKLPGVISSIRGYHVGPDAGVNAANCDFAIVADFDDVAGYLAYRDHPAHVAAVQDYVSPVVAQRFSAQYEI